MSKNKEIMTSFLKMCAAGDVAKAYDTYAASNFTHHNQYFKGDRESLKKAMMEAHTKTPNRSFEVKYVYEDGNTVVSHSKVVQEAGVIAVVHIGRIENGKIVEMWDLGQLIDKNSPNENGPF